MTNKQIIINNLLNTWTDFETYMKFVPNWTNFYNIVTKYNLSTTQQNDLFKKFCKYMLLYHPSLKYNFTGVKLISETTFNYICDIIVKTNTNEIIPVYCIFKENTDNLSNNDTMSSNFPKIIITNAKNNYNNLQINIIDNTFFENNLRKDDFINMVNNIVTLMDIG